MPQTVLFDRYRLIEPAGRGGSAEVWRALDEVTGDEVAVKRLHPVVFADEAGRRRLQREFDAIRTLDEPHVVRVRDLRFGEREAALVLDFVPGESLAARLARHASEATTMPPEAAIAIVEDVAAALAAAHAAGIVHRDVTPGNILLTPDGEARLTDFGIAHVGGDEAAGDVTATGLLMGTMRYLAPEQLRGDGSTPASDLHGLAAVAYEMLAGHPAYEAASPVALADAQEAGPQAIDALPASVDAALRRGLAVDPGQRPSDVRSFAASLAAALADEVTVALPLDPRDRTALIAVASPARVAAAHALLPVAVGPSGRSAAEPWRPPRPSRRRAARVPGPVAAVLGLLVAAGALVAATRLDGAAAAAPADQQASATPVVAVDPPPTARPTAPPAPADTPGKGDKGKGKGNGKGH